MKRLTRLALLALLLVLAAVSLTWFRRGAARDPIRVGVLHSLTGTMAISERSVVDATLVAIEEVTGRVVSWPTRGGGRPRRSLELVHVRQRGQASHPSGSGGAAPQA